MTDLVFNEPIATGWLQAQLSGDVDMAKQYLLEARRMVGQLRTTNGVNERIADGEAGGFYKATRSFDDGTRIEVYTNNGNDVVRVSTPKRSKSEEVGKPSEDYITPGDAPTIFNSAEHETSMPPVPQLSPRKRLRELRKQANDTIEIEDYAECGACRDSTTFKRHAVVWYSLHPLDLGFLPGGDDAAATAISGDAQVVVGWSWTESERKAFRWTKTGGMVAIEQTIPAGTKFAQATDVNWDGSMICGTCSSSVLGNVAWVWTAATGMVQLPDVGLGVPFLSLPKISQSGEYIVSTVNITPENAYTNSKGVVWRKASPEATVFGLTDVPRPGTTTVHVQPNGSTESTPDYLTPAADSSTPVDVTDGGRIVIFTAHHDVVGPYLSGLDTVTGSESHGYYEVIPLVESVFVWDAATGERAIIADGTPCAAADEVDVIVGNTEEGHLYEFVNTDPNGSFNKTIIYEPRWSFGWYRVTDGQFSLGIGTKTYAISADGEIIGGSILDGGSNEQPLIWQSGKDDPTRLDLLEGTFSGYVSGVAHMTDEWDLPPYDLPEIEVQEEL